MAFETGGGSAFPTSARKELRDSSTNSSNKFEVSIPANDGMTIRDYFAGQVAAGDAAAGEGWGDALSETAVTARAELYYRLADAMLAVRNR